MKRILFIIIITCISISSYASSNQKSIADQAYGKGQYQQAMQIYNTLLKDGESADVYYNLGNCYYRTRDMAHAILCYERAHLLKPGDADIRANLALAKSKIQDKTVASSEMFFVKWYYDLVNLKSSDQWSRCAILSFILLLASISLYVFVNQIRLKKMGFGAAIFFLCVTIFSNIFSYHQKEALVDRNSAVVMVPAATAHSTPSESGTALFVVHQGHVVKIKDNSMKMWKEIQLEDGNIGWIKISDLEII